MNGAQIRWGRQAQAKRNGQRTHTVYTARLHSHKHCLHEIPSNAPTHFGPNSLILKALRLGTGEISWLHTPLCCHCDHRLWDWQDFKMKFQAPAVCPWFHDRLWLCGAKEHFALSAFTLWNPETPDAKRLVWFYLCKLLESEFNPSGLMKMNSQNLIPYRSLWGNWELRVIQQIEFHKEIRVDH